MCPTWELNPPVAFAAQPVLQEAFWLPPPPPGPHCFLRPLDLRDLAAWIFAPRSPTGCLRATVLASPVSKIPLLQLTASVAW